MQLSKTALRKIENAEKDELNKPVEILKFAKIINELISILNLSPVDEFYNELLDNVINEDKNGLVIDAGIDNLNKAHWIVYS